MRERGNEKKLKDVINKGAIAKLPSWSQHSALAK
jgi:hypothetical protein